MKTSILVAAIFAGVLSAPMVSVSAQDKAAPAMPAMSMDMSGQMPQMPQMQENMKQMQEQMEKLRATTDPQEREKLMQAHMQTMQARQKLMHEHMHTMHSSGGPMMGMMGAKHGGSMTNMEPKQADEFIRRRMERQQKTESVPAN